jgi:hypothetical protein
MKKIEETIKTVSKSIRSGVNLGLIRMVLISENFPIYRVDTMIRWAKRIAEAEVNQTLDLH